LSAVTPLPDKGCVFISVNDRDKPAAVEVARSFAQFGFQLAATRGTAAVLKAAGLACKTILNSSSTPLTSNPPVFRELGF